MNRAYLIETASHLKCVNAKSLDEYLKNSDVLSAQIN